MATPAEIVCAAREGQRDAALRELRLALEYPVDPEPCAGWAEALAAVARAFGAGPLAAAADAVAIDPDDAAALFELGWLLVEGALYGQAATFLARAARLRPGEPKILLELAAALESAGMNAAARDVLGAEPALRAGSFDARYRYAFNAVLAGDLPSARAASAALTPATPDERALAVRVADMLARADAVAEVTPLDDEDLRGWHFVTTGGLLLHRSPHGFASMRGRYAWIQDSFAGCLECLLRLRRLLGFLRLEPKQLLVLPDRDSTIFAAAAAKALRLPVAPWTPGSKEKGLVLAYDLSAADLELRQSLVQRRPGQILWSRALSWTNTVGLTPEFTGQLHQINSTPWGARLVRDPDTGDTEKRPPLSGSAEELASRILAADVEDLPEQGELDRLAQAGDVPAAAWRKKGGQREPMWFMGPVKSSRFY